MKTKFLYVFLSICYLFCFSLPSFSASQIVADNALWRSSINTKSQQLTINGQDNDFIITLFIYSGRQSLLQITYLQNSNFLKDTYALNFSIGTQNFTLRKQNSITKNNQTYFKINLTTQQLKIFIHDFTAKENAYITINNDIIPISLTGTSLIVSRLLQYLDKQPMPELPSPFGKLSASNTISLSDFSIFHNQLLYGMGIVVFLLLFGRPLINFFVSIYKRRMKNHSRKKALRIANYQIKQYANILYIKRDQLIYKDEYGSLVEDKWLQEVNRFIKSKIKPDLSDYQLLNFFPQIKKEVIKNILYTAKYPPKKQTRFFQRTKKIRHKFSPKMNPFDYEVYCAELLNQSGWDAEVTTASGDQGADVIAVKRGVTLIIQCKLYSKPVGNKAVQEVNAAKTFYHAHYAAVVSNAAYTTSARQLAASTKVALLHHETLEGFASSLT
ncbi:Endonuclease [Commensalibacter communis]|uniref:HJR/Mrr/RecB family n=1 Tax=Commensalibacter communis TaxID=2972786 RepID=A0A9W4X6B1_9PROT|nr:restriction endonuclease [Commensalibacter communis]CAI3924946.1 Endonuclease [Commensalibacter communis]CAI3925466.1 Endonuclease [Commensalibacter communis]CAI3935864.1 Endonuclease [Commensalibacter communis]CAI3937516.1 Endonuclease [Commensalibacter communis]